MSDAQTGASVTYGSPKTTIRLVLSPRGCGQSHSVVTAASRRGGYRRRVAPMVSAEWGPGRNKMGAVKIAYLVHFRGGSESGILRRWRPRLPPGGSSARMSGSSWPHLQRRSRRGRLAGSRVRSHAVEQPVRHPRLPVVVGCRNTHFPDGAPFILQIPNAPGGVRTAPDTIRPFLDSWLGRRVPRSEIRNLDVSVKESTRIRFIEAAARG
jgi:hypothetical protein